LTFVLPLSLFCFQTVESCCAQWKPSILTAKQHAGRAKTNTML